MLPNANTFRFITDGALAAIGWPVMRQFHINYLYFSLLFYNRWNNKDRTVDKKDKKKKRKRSSRSSSESSEEERHSKKLKKNNKKKHQSETKQAAQHKDPRDPIAL